jgi:hypothetical protein
MLYEHLDGRVQFSSAAGRPQRSVLVGPPWTPALSALPVHTHTSCRAGRQPVFPIRQPSEEAVFLKPEDEFLFPTRSMEPASDAVMTWQKTTTQGIADER